MTNYTGAYTGPQIDATLQNRCGGSNLIKNGNFDVWQRGDPIALSTGGYTADRWYNLNNAGAATTMSRQSGAWANDANGNSLSCGRFQRNGGSATATYITAAYSMETIDSVKFVGRYLTFSCKVRGGANFSAADGKLNCLIKTGTGTDEKCTAYTGNSDIGTGNITLSTNGTAQTLMVTSLSSVPTNVTELGVEVYYNTSGTAGAADYFEVCQAQLLLGTAALPYALRSYGEELGLCQRYYYDSISNRMGGNAMNANAVLGPFQYPSEMRATPTLVIYNSYSGTQNHARRTDNGVDIPMTTPLIISPGPAGAAGIYDGGGTPFTAGVAYDWRIIANAEL